MVVTTTLRLYIADPESVVALMRRFNSACSWLSGVAFAEQIWHWLPLQKRAYHELRERFNIDGAQTTVAIRKVAAAYRDKAKRAAQATFRPLGAIPVWRHTVRGSTIRLYGISATFQARDGISLPPKPSQAALSYRNGKFILNQPLDVEVSSERVAEDFLGVDLGIVNLAVDSDGDIYTGEHVRNLRRRHARLRSRLQVKGTKSAKRLMKNRRYKETRFASYVNHCISKHLVAKADRRVMGIALEDLSGIRQRVQVRKAQRRDHHSWAFFQLRTFVAYKAALAGVPFVLVDPRNTSRECPACHHIDKANRISRDAFCCQSCGHAGAADYFAALNIRGRAVGSQSHAAASHG